MPDREFWKTLASEPAPLFGSENDDRLARGTAPERYNPISGRVESLLRDSTEAALLWPWTPGSATVVGLDQDQEEEE